MKEKIYKKLNIAIKPDYLEVIDESHLHRNHAQNLKKSESHFKVIISSSNLSNKSRIDAHRQIYQILDYELKHDGLHALAISIITKP